MRRFNTLAGLLPRIWLLSDARNDEVLARVLRAHGRELGLVYRHYHLAPGPRRARFARLKALAAARGQMVVLAGTPAQARGWGAAGCYGPPATLAPRRKGLVMIATVHNLAQIGHAHRAGASAMMLSPVFSTRSHPGAPGLGVMRFGLLAARACAPVIALGGMSAARARRLGWPMWAAIDGLADNAGRAPARQRRQQGRNKY